ncbi:MAG: hypothetical protein V1904_00905 [Bacteroidota bacterium]
MKRFIIPFLLCIAANSNAQVNYASSSEIKQFLKSKTMVVKTDDPFSSLDSVLEVYMKKIWTITSYEFITSDEFETKMSSTAYSFIFLSEGEIKEGGTTCTYDILNLILGGSTDLNIMPDLGSVPLCYTEQDESIYLYKVGGILQFMQTHVNYASEHPSITPAIVNKDSGYDIKKMELWLVKDDLPSSHNTTDKIKLIYSYSVKIVTAEDIRKAVENKTENVVYLHKIGPGTTAAGCKCWKFLVTAKDGEVLYYDSHKVDSSSPDAFLEKDFKSIGK